LYIYAGTSQGIYYETDGTAPNRTLAFEYYTSHYAASNQYYHFQVIFYENLPGIVTYVYYQSSDTGISCTIGVQGNNRLKKISLSSKLIDSYFFSLASSSGPDIQYSFDQQYSVSPNMTLTFNTNLGTFTTGTIG